MFWLADKTYNKKSHNNKYESDDSTVATGILFLALCLSPPSLLSTNIYDQKTCKCWGNIWCRSPAGCCLLSRHELAIMRLNIGPTHLSQLEIWCCTHMTRASCSRESAGSSTLWAVSSGANKSKWWPETWYQKKSDLGIYLLIRVLIRFVYTRVGYKISS